MKGLLEGCRVFGLEAGNRDGKLRGTGRLMIF